MKNILFAFAFLCANNIAIAQLKFLIEDFEGFADGSSHLEINGVFTYGNSKATIEKSNSQLSYSGDRFIKLSKQGKMNYGGWGKGVNANVVLDVNTDFLNFYVYQPSGNDTNTIKIALYEDDNDNNLYEKNNDDSWNYLYKIDTKDTWQLISIPLNKFVDANKGGDGIFNINYKEGKLLTFIINFVDSKHSKITAQNWSFDFICFSKGQLPTGPRLFDAPIASINDFCNLGAWSQEGNSGNFT